jgi:protein-S-isoprenylcysteine O-methyltransferase Ste14
MTGIAQPGWFLKIPPPIWMLAMLICAFVIDRAIGPLPFEVQSLWFAAVLALGGIALDIWAFAVFRSAGTEILPASTSNKTLVVLGPYRFTRNPMYLGLILLSLAIAFSAGKILYFAVPVLMFLLCNGLFIPFEEAKMQRQFKDQYTDYVASVRRWI